ncbi:MAG: DUF1508 domain-containing protein [Acidimicrobiia bacterium]|jgi:uncharacterized protein YegP (UPF0339 family)|nr:DUF1508 domain-containing protein [Acidimicrobiia bacterium]
MKYKVQKSASGQYWFTIVASNGQKLAHSEQYAAKASAIAAANTIKGEGGSGTIVDLT